MGLVETDTLVSELQDLTDEGLRVVVQFDQEGYEPVYVRDDMSQRIEELADDVHEELVLQGIGRVHVEDIFEAGALHCSAHHFEDLIAFYLAMGESEGVFLTVDSTAEVPLTRFTERCKDHVE